MALAPLSAAGDESESTGAGATEELRFDDLADLMRGLYSNVYSAADVARQLEERRDLVWDRLATENGTPTVAQFRVKDEMLHFVLAAGSARAAISLPYSLPYEMVDPTYRQIYGRPLVEADLSLVPHPIRTWSLGEIEEAVVGSGAPWGLVDRWSLPVRVVVAPDQESRAHVFLIGSGPDGDPETSDDAILAHRMIDDRIRVREKVSPALARAGAGINAGQINFPTLPTRVSPSGHPHQETHVQEDGSFAVLLERKASLWFRVISGLDPLEDLELPLRLGQVYFAYLSHGRSPDYGYRGRRTFEMTPRGIQASYPDGAICGVGLVGRLREWSFDLDSRRRARSGEDLPFSLKTSERWFPGGGFGGKEFRAELLDQSGNVSATLSDDWLETEGASGDARRLAVPADTEPGDYALRVCVRSQGERYGNLKTGLVPMCRVRALVVRG